MSMLALTDIFKYITKGGSMCFYIIVLALTDTDKYITEGYLNVFNISMFALQVGSG